MTREFHSEPFEETTLTKLRLYKAYIHSWLPVFLNTSSYVSEMWLFDLFCGPGCDSNDVDGSPIILLEELAIYLRSKSTSNPPRIRVVFNDKKKWKIRKLQELINSRPKLPPIVTVEYYTEKYPDIFPYVAVNANRSDTACFIFIDQCGVNAIEDCYVRQLSNFPRTDWLAFVASSQARRFLEHENIKFQLLKKGEWRDAHRTVADTCRAVIDSDEYYLVPFSIKNKSNIHGLLFGSGHPLGAEKFINACWSEDKNAGEANFDIDGVIQNPSSMLKMIPSKKLDAFEAELKVKILDHEISTNKEAYIFALQSGVKASHAKDALRRFKENGLVKKIPCLSYSSIMSKKIVEPIEPMG